MVFAISVVAMSSLCNGRAGKRVVLWRAVSGEGHGGARAAQTADRAHHKVISIGPTL